MPRITKVYTRTGDDGTTGLGTGERVSKEAPRIQAYGDVDELNAYIGLILTGTLPDELSAVLRTIQNELFHAGADLCIPDADKPKLPGPRIEPRHVAQLESWIDRFSESLAPLENFILPGGTPEAAQLHIARTVCRRAERTAIMLHHQEPISSDLIHYLNRLSDALFVFARYQNHSVGVEDPCWDSRS